MDIDRIRDETTGKLPSYAWPGGYPMFYLDGHNSVLCPDCANEASTDDDPKFRPVAGDVNWEDPTLYCDNCNERIESACADDIE